MRSGANNDDVNDIVTLVCRWKLRASSDERVHNAVVSDAVRHVSSQVDRSASLGRCTTRGIRDLAASVCRHMGKDAGVSESFVCATLIFRAPNH